MTLSLPDTGGAQAARWSQDAHALKWLQSHRPARVIARLRQAVNLGLLPTQNLCERPTPAALYEMLDGAVKRRWGRTMPPKMPAKLPARVNSEALTGMFHAVRTFAGAGLVSHRALTGFEGDLGSRLFEAYRAGLARIATRAQRRLKTAYRLVTELLPGTAAQLENVSEVSSGLIVSPMTSDIVEFGVSRETPLLCVYPSDTLYMAVPTWVHQHSAQAEAVVCALERLARHAPWGYGPLGTLYEMDGDAPFGAYEFYLDELHQVATQFGGLGTLHKALLDGDECAVVEVSEHCDIDLAFEILDVCGPRQEDIKRWISLLSQSDSLPPRRRGHAGLHAWLRVARACMGALERTEFPVWFGEGEVVGEPTLALAPGLFPVLEDLELNASWEGLMNGDQSVVFLPVDDHLPLRLEQAMVEWRSLVLLIVLLVNLESENVEH